MEKPIKMDDFPIFGNIHMETWPESLREVVGFFNKWIPRFELNMLNASLGAAEQLRGSTEHSADQL